MGELVLAAKITHVPSIWLSLQDGKHHGIRRGAERGVARGGPAGARARGGHVCRRRHALAELVRVPRQRQGRPLGIAMPRTSCRHFIQDLPYPIRATRN